MIEKAIKERVRIPIGDVFLPGEMEIPRLATSLVIFSHGSGSSRLSPRNQFVARHLINNGIGTFLFDLLTPGYSPQPNGSRGKLFPKI